MTNKNFTKRLMAALGVGVLAVVVAATAAYAWNGYGHMSGGGPMGPGYGSGYNTGPGYGGGNHMGRGYMMGGRYPVDATTQRLRTSLWAKWRALQLELAQAKPNLARVKALQAEVTKLRLDLTKRLSQYRPQYGPGPGRGYCW